MIFLDANVYYWYLGREILFDKPSVPKHDVEKLNRYLDDQTEKGIPASVFMEMIVHFRDKPDAIMKIMRFLEKKRISVFNNLRARRFTEKELLPLCIAEDEAILKQYAYKLMNEKIAIEVMHACVFLQIVSVFYADYYLKSQDSLNNEIRKTVLSFLGKDIFDKLRDEHYSRLASALQKGYKNGDRSQQALKKKYNELLVENCIMFRAIIDAIVRSPEDDPYAVICKSVDEVQYNDAYKDDAIMHTIRAVLSTNSEFLRIAENKISSVFEQRGYSKKQAEYFKSMLKAWLERGQKLIKNDIFDMLCVGALDKVVTNSTRGILMDQNSYLISFDETMMKFLCRNTGNARLLNRFLLPEHKLPI